MLSVTAAPARPRDNSDTVAVGRGSPRPASHRRSRLAPDSSLRPAVHRVQRSPGRRDAGVRIAAALSDRSGRIGRVVDIVGASVGLLVTAPVLVVTAAAIRVSSRGPVVFKHERLGRNYEPFNCLKFRTMHRDSERIIEELRLIRPDIDAEFANSFKLRDDPRISRLGRFLRKTSIDELPQLFNVLRGEMSLVGPRPIVADEGAMYGPQLPHVLSVRPGMTGAWQVGGRSKVDYPERVDIDVDYVNRKSVAADLAILLKTPAALLDWQATS